MADHSSQLIAATKTLQVKCVSAAGLQANDLEKLVEVVASAEAEGIAADNDSLVQAKEAIATGEVQCCLGGSRFSIARSRLTVFCFL
jgi:hypothetical protein